MSTYLPQDLVDRLRQIPVDQNLLVCCDFDGTLAPIVTRPEDARPLPGTGMLLLRLAETPATHVAVVSGRSLADLQTLSGFAEPLVLVGSHGGEFTSGFVSDLTPRQEDLLRELDEVLSRMISEAPGAELERKPLSIAVHVRQASRPDAERVLTAVREGPALWPGVHATAGKEVLELAVQQVDKGSAVESLRHRYGPGTAVVFIGDDVTDERAFAVLGAEDVGVKVGDGPTAAEYRVPDVSSVPSILMLLAALR